jgi:hypothetical protein
MLISFNERIVRYIPVFCKDDFDPLVLHDEHRHLAYCICYVTSFFLPGGSSIGQALQKHISDFVLEKCMSIPGTQQDDLRDLQAMMILYAYSKPSSAHSTPHHPIPASLLKNLVEGHAISAGFHRSFEGVKAAVKSIGTASTTTSAYKRYTYWLWLYTLAHQ